MPAALRAMRDTLSTTFSLGGVPPRPPGRILPGMVGGAATGSAAGRAGWWRGVAAGWAVASGRAPRAGSARASATERARARPGWGGGEGEGEGEAGGLDGAGRCGSRSPVLGTLEVEPVEADDELDAERAELASPAERVKALENGDHETGSFGSGKEPESP